MTEAGTKRVDPDMRDERRAGRQPSAAAPSSAGIRPRPRIVISVLLAAAFVGIACLVGIACSPAGQQSTAASAAVPRADAAQAAASANTPEVSLATADGSTFRLSAQRGKVVGFYVMASWCGTCVPESKAWDRLLNEQGSQGLTAVAVSGDPTDTAVSLHQFATLANAQHLIYALDPQATFVHQFQVRSLDSTLIFDRSGKLVFRNSVPMSYDALRTAVEKAL